MVRGARPQVYGVYSSKQRITMDGASTEHASAEGVVGDALAECAICFDLIVQRPPLPCNCRVDYCLCCWDRCLLQSFWSVGQARCPTCRTPVHVDFDADLGGLVFSRETAEFTDRSSQVKRLLQQVLPAQVKILQRYGVANPALQEIARAADAPESLARFSTEDMRHHITALGGSTDGCPEEGLAMRLRDALGGSASTLASFWAARAGGVQESPKCVCGAPLVRSTVEDRLTCVSMRAQYQYLICDLCDQPVGLQSVVWSCTLGTSTILHANAYDVCDSCFVQHVFLDGAGPTACVPSSPSQSESDTASS